MKMNLKTNRLVVKIIVSFLYSNIIEGIHGQRWDRTQHEYTVWTEEASLAPLGAPLKENLPLCQEGMEQQLCLHPSDHPMSWMDSHSYCRRLDGFLASQNQYQYLNLWWPNSRWNVTTNITWTSFTNYEGQYQWLGQSPARSSFENWREMPDPWSKECAAFNLTTQEFQLHECLEQLHFYCVINKSESFFGEVDFSDIELRVTGNKRDFYGLIQISQKDFNNLSLTCKAFNKTTGHMLENQPHYFWRKDNVYIDHSNGGLQPSTAHDSSKSDTVTPGISEIINQAQLNQGTFWCESWIPFSQKRLESNKILVTLNEWATLIFRAERKENTTVTQEKVKKDLINLFRKEYQDISSYTWDTISIDKEPIINSSSYLAKYKFHVHMPRADLNLKGLKNYKFLKRYNKIFKKGKFLDTSNLTFATFCYHQVESFNSGRNLSWPFTEAGHIHPQNYKCKTMYGKLRPGLCKGDYMRGAYLNFDPSQCKWLDQCPSGYKGIRKKYCVALSEPADWETGFKNTYKTSQEKSLLDNPDTSETSESLYKIIKNEVANTNNQSMIWIPLKRVRPLGPLVFSGPGTTNRDYQRYDEFADNGISWANQHPRIDRDCVAFNFQTKELQTLQCNETLPILSIIAINIHRRSKQQLSHVSPKCNEQESDKCLCPPGWNTPIYKGENETCFKLFKNTGNMTWIEAKQFCEEREAQLPSPNVGFLDWVYRKHLINNKISSVWMGIEWIPDRIIYNGPENSINWLPQTNYSLRYGTLKQDGWILEDDNTVKDNVLCQQIKHPEVKMQLQINEPVSKDSQTMCIDISPEQLLMNGSKDSIRCYVNGDELVHEQTTDSGCQFELKVSKQGYYQCQAWTRPPFMLSKSNTILHRDFGTYTFVLTLSQKEKYIPEKHDITFMNRQRQVQNSRSCTEILRKYLESTDLNQFFRFSITLSFNSPDSNFSKILHSHLESEIRSETTMDEKELLYKLKDKLHLINEFEASNCTFEEIRSTVGCLSDITIDESYEDTRNLTWPKTVGNEIVIPEELCITSEGEPVTRECLGDFIEGYYWGEPSHTCNGIPSNFTKTLWEMHNQTASYSMGTILADLTSNQSLSPADIHFVSKAVQSLAEIEIPKYSLDDIVRVMSNVMGANATAFDMIQRKLNTSSALLGAFEDLTFKVKLPNIMGDQSMKSSKKLVSIERLDLEANSSIVGFKSHGKYEETLLSGFKEEDLIQAEAAIILPKNLTYIVSSKTVRQSGSRDLDEIEEKIPVAFAVFQNEKLFQDKNTYENYTVNSRIIMASYKGKIIKGLQEPVRILFKPLKRGNDTKCVFWDFTLNNKRGGWSEEGCMKEESNGEHNVCLCNHLTSFAELINYGIDDDFDSTHAKILDIITIVGCCLSIMGLLLVFTTFFLFKKWRRSLSNKILVNLSFSVFCSMVIFLAGIDQTWNEQLCRSVAVGLHYFILASFGWMLVEAVHQYLKFVKVVGTYIPRFLWKASVCAWGIPVLPILIILIYDHSLYDSRNEYNVDFKICWMSVNGFKYAFLPPLALTMTVNLVMYSLIIHGAICGRARVNSTMSERTLFMNQLRMAVCVFFLLGFTWIFGLLAVCQLRPVFSYLFCIFNTLQGFFLFLFHVCREQGARMYWKDFLSVLTKDSLSSTPGNSFHHVNSHQFKGHPDSVIFDKCGGILVLPMGPPLRPQLRRTNRQSMLSARTNSTLIQSRTSFNP